MPKSKSKPIIKINDKIVNKKNSIIKEESYLKKESNSKISFSRRNSKDRGSPQDP